MIFINARLCCNVLSDEQINTFGVVCSNRTTAAPLDYYIKKYT